MNPHVATLFTQRAVIARREHPEHDRVLRRALHRGEVVAVLPGVYAPAGRALSLEDRARAVCLADPRAVVAGTAAARLTFWPELPEPDAVEAVTRLRSRPGYRFVQRSVPTPLRRRLAGCTVTSRPLTALDLGVALGGEAIDRALRAGATIDELWQAYRLVPGRPDNALRRQLLLESRDAPWSPAERAAHRALHDADVRGWSANLSVQTSEGRVYLDIAFGRLKLALEIDGYGFHGSHDRFLSDRRRDAALAAQGWQVVRFAAATVLSSPEVFVAQVRAILAARARALGCAG